MKDKGLGIWLILLFGVSGLGVILLAWLSPSLASERLVATIAGGVGLTVATLRAVTLKKSQEEVHEDEVTFQVIADNES